MSKLGTNQNDQPEDEMPLKEPDILRIPTEWVRKAVTFALVLLGIGVLSFCYKANLVGFAFIGAAMLSQYLFFAFAPFFVREKVTPSAVLPEGEVTYSRDRQTGHRRYTYPNGDYFLLNARGELVDVYIASPSPQD
ncbi:MAG: hypothetical protein K2W95_29985 [Candidatus Obscuribacterales bacterium]|nr:hypothetical protein [Candidatus Obscuribacterales bacterium]